MNGICNFFFTLTCTICWKYWALTTLKLRDNYRYFPACMSSLIGSATRLPLFWEVWTALPLSIFKTSPMISIVASKSWTIGLQTLAISMWKPLSTSSAWPLRAVWECILRGTEQGCPSDNTGSYLPLSLSAGPPSSLLGWRCGEITPLVNSKP